MKEIGLSDSISEAESSRSSDGDIGELFAGILNERAKKIALDDEEFEGHGFEQNSSGSDNNKKSSSRRFRFRPGGGFRKKAKEVLGTAVSKPRIAFVNLIANAHPGLRPSGGLHFPDYLEFNQRGWKCIPVRYPATCASSPTQYKDPRPVLKSNSEPPLPPRRGFEAVWMSCRDHLSPAMKHWPIADTLFRNFEKEQPNAVWCFAATRDKKYLAAGSKNGLIYIWEMNFQDRESIVDFCRRPPQFFCRQYYLESVCLSVTQLVL